MSGKFNIVAGVVLLVATVVGGTLSNHLSGPSLPGGGGGAAAAVADGIGKDYSAAVSTVSDNYAGEIDHEKATQAAIQGMLTTLDPHSMFFPAAEFQKLHEEQGSRFYGIGVTILQHLDGVYVQSTVADTPAARAGLRYGDRIVEVDGEDAREWTSDQVSKKVRGERGEEVKLKIERAGSQAPLHFKIVRDAVPLPSIVNYYAIRPGIGYVGLTRGFQHTTGEELREAIAQLKKEGVRQLVLDLRGNPGGLLDQAIEVASEFLPRGQPVVSVRGRSEYGEPVVHKSRGNDPEELPLVVMISRNSASASEIVAGAIQDHGRGLVVGETSFGKGLVQRVFQLPFGTGLTLTTAKYYTPYGRSLQRDYASGSFYDYYVRHGAVEETLTPTQPAAAPPPATAPPAPPPTGPAVRTAAGRVFYGGGGITPDIEARPLAATPLRTRMAEATFQFTRQLVSGQIPGLENYLVTKPGYGRVPRATDYPVTDRVTEAFREYLRRDERLGLQPGQVDAEIDFAKRRLRYEIVTAAFSGDAGARVLTENDSQTLQALEALPKAKTLAESVRTGTPIS